MVEQNTIIVLENSNKISNSIIINDIFFVFLRSINNTYPTRTTVLSNTFNMFAHRSVGLTSHQGRNRGVLSVQNENGVHRSSAKSSATTTKTPASSKNSLRPRRAFGDISNKKSTNNNNNNGGKESIVLKPRATTFTPRSTRSSSQSLIPKQASHSKTVTTKTSSKTSNNQRKINVPLGRTHLKPPSTITTKTLVKVAPVDNIELPAGRLWVDQMENDDHDDDWSTSSMEKDFTRTMWDDWGSSLRQKHQEQQTELDRQQDSEVHAHIERVMKEQDEGTCALRVSLIHS
jgi:hypothetical protein